MKTTNNLFLIGFMGAGKSYTEEAGLKGPFMDNGVNLMAALFEQD